MARSRRPAAIAFAAIVAIVILSLLPGYWQERTGLPPPLEHFLAYLGTAGLMGFSWPGALRGIRHIAILACLSASMELLQHFSPGRDPRLADILWSTLGAILGVGVAFLAKVALESRWRQHEA